MPAEARFLNLVKRRSVWMGGINAGNRPFSSAQTLISLFLQPRRKVVCIRSVCLMCQGFPLNVPIWMLWWTSCYSGSILELSFLGFVRAETCQSPPRLVFEFFRSLPELKHLLPQLKLCQRVQGPWHEWYWKSNESPTGGLFTWSHILGALIEEGFFFFFFATNVSALVPINPELWQGMIQCNPE